jgi:glycine cleavage system H protein
MNLASSVGMGTMYDQLDNENCPFLKEERVVFCKAFSLRKILPLEKIFDKENICLKKEHRSCPIFMEKKAKDDYPEARVCHFMGTENIIYCTLSPTKKMIPLYSLKFEGPCSNKTYGNCVFYQKMLQGDQKTTSVQGFLLGEELYYHSSHIWLRRLKNNIRIGLDDFGQFIIGKIREVFLPEPGQKIKADKPFMSLTGDDGVADLLSPVDGSIVGVNDAVRENASLINLDPYGEGWLVEVQPSERSAHFDEETAVIFHGNATRPWLETEIRKLRHVIENEIGITVADGGEIWRGLRDAIGEKRNLLVKSFFGTEGR